MATIDIGGIGKVEIPDNMMWASEETQKRIESLLKGKGGGSQGGIFGQAQKSSAGVSKNLSVMGSSITKINPALRAVEAGFNTLGTAISGAAGLVAGVFESTGRFSDLNPVVDMATQTFQGLVGSVPIVGGFLSGIAGANAEILKLRLGLMDLQADTFETLALSGAKLDQNFSDLIGNILKSNIPLNQFNEIVRENTEGLLAFGGNTQRAFTRFNQNIDDLTRLDSPIGLGLRTLGLGATDIAEYFAEFIQNNRFSSKVLSLQNSELQQILARRIRDERVITEITGIRAEEQRAAERELATEGAFLAALQQFPAEVQIALKEYVAKLKTVDPQAAKLAQEQIAFGSISSNESGRFAALLPDLANTVTSSVELMKAGNTDVAGQMLMFSKSAQQFATSIEGANLAVLGLVEGGQEIGNTVENAFKLGLRQEAQEKSLAIIEGNLGRSFGSLTEGLDAIEAQYDAQIKAIQKTIDVNEDYANMSPEQQTEFFQKALQEATKIQDQQTINLIAARAGFEDLVSDFQSKTFSTLMGSFEGLSGVIAEVTTNFNKLLDKFEGRPAGADPNNLMNPKPPEKFTGGPVAPNTMSIVGEAGRELIKMGNQGGEVINNATTEKIMGAANAVVNNMGNDGNDVLKQISDILNQSNTIQSNILKETRRSKGFQY